MADIDKLPIAKSIQDLFILAKMANRHGLIAGATGIGKTISLKLMADIRFHHEEIVRAVQASH